MNSADDESRERGRKLSARLVAAARNALEISRFGALGSSEPTPHEVVASERVYRLRRYPSEDPKGPPLLLVPPLMLTAEVYDVDPNKSAVRFLGANGIDPWVVDFGAPEREEGGLERTLADHVVAVSDAVDRVRRETGRAVHLGGYSQGGMFCYQAAAYRRSEGVASVVTFGSPVDLRRGLPPGVPEEIVDWAGLGVEWLASLVTIGGGVPAWVSRIGFRLISPVKDLRQQIDFLRRLYDREAIRRREAQRRFLASEGWVAFPGPAFRDFIAEFVVNNRLLSGGLVIDGKSVTLADITAPILAFVGEIDEIARPPAVRSIQRAVPRADLWEMPMQAGHFGLVVGSKAMDTAWPTVAGWIRWTEGDGDPPPGIRRMSERAQPQAAAIDEEVRDGVALLGDTFADVVRSLGQGVQQAIAPLWHALEMGVPQVMRISRIERVRRDTRIGMGLVLAEQAERAPNDTFFLFEGRAYSYAQAERRVDAVARGLVSLGVRQGDPIGILMSTRPSALAAATALSRIGAIAVMLRPDGDLEREIALGEVAHVIADPEHAGRARAALGADVWVLGGGGTARTLPAGQVDMEAIDPARVVMPSWYAANPGRAEEIAFVLFSGRGPGARAYRITNRRWALSAFGAAAAGALTAGDTVYCSTPIHHPTGILVCVGGALVGGARLAVATRWEASTFWDEARRYGASVVFYTGTMCRELVTAPFDPAERDHSVRLFAGSGMPRALWSRLRARFGVNVLEFYATTEGNAILANLSGTKIGCVGQPFAGSAPVAIAAYDLARGELVHEPSGFCRPCEDEEAGLLLVRVERERGALIERPIRGVFQPDDAWLATSDLFRRDADGDFWLVDHLEDVIRTAEGPVFCAPIEDAISGLEFVDLAVAYGIARGGRRGEVPAVALTLRQGLPLDLDALQARAENELAAGMRPMIVRVLATLPMTAGYRPVKEPLRAAGFADVAQGFVFDEEGGRYRPLEVDDAAKLGIGKPAARRAGRRSAAPPAAR